jgi:putative transposase
MIASEWIADLHAYLGGTCKGLGAMPLEVGGVADHVHLLVSCKTTHSVADLVREVKKSSSAWAVERWSRFGWQEGYAAFSVGPREVDAVRQYIRNQAQHHRQLGSAEELRGLLEEHGIEVDERFFA